MNGIDCFFEGLTLVRKPGLRKYVIIPVLINTIVLSAVMAYGYMQYDAWLLALTSFLPDWLSFLSSIIGILAAIVIFALSIYCFSIVANIIASPFNAMLSLKIEERLSGTKISSDTHLLLIVGRAFSREISKLLYFLPRLLGLVILSIIPGLNTLAPFAWIIFGAWMMAIQYSDYAADNNEISFSELRARLSESIFQTLLFGIIVYFAIAIPLLNLVVIPIAVAGGTVFWVEHLHRQTLGVS